MDVMRYNQNGDITALSPFYGWLILVMCIPATVFLVRHLMTATEWWQYAGSAIWFLALSVAFRWGIKSVRSSTKSPAIGQES